VKVLSLQCGLQHQFEGWFADEADFKSQLERGLLVCPVCNHHDITKLPSAPRLNLRAQDNYPRRDTSDASEVAAPAATVDAPALQAAVWQALRQLVQQTDNVGERFTDEALAMHRGDIEQRPIRGQATREQMVQLLDEGVDLLPLPPGLDDPLH
jgi:hypothetical protein